MRGIVKERAAATRTKTAPWRSGYKEARSRLFLSEMPFGARIVAANSYSFPKIEEGAHMIYFISDRGNGPHPLGGYRSLLESLRRSDGRYDVWH